MCDESDDGCDDAARLCALKLTSELCGQADGDSAEGQKLFTQQEELEAAQNHLAARCRSCALYVHQSKPTPCRTFTDQTTDGTGPSPFCGRYQVTK